MASVYSNAYLTIAASSSADGGGGCAVTDSDRSYGPVDIDCIPSASDSTATTKQNYKFRVWTGTPSTTGFRGEPLQTRGWTLQERELSPRVVNYSKDTIRWECRSTCASLEFPWSDALIFNGERRHFDEEQSTFLPMPGVTLSTDSSIDPRAVRPLAWIDLVVQYTSRNLTKHSDILPAISGIARTIAAQTSDSYFAGLWESSFAQCLLWASDWSIGQGLQTHYRTSTSFAPSWSWASIRGKVSWPMNGVWYKFNPDPEPEFIPRILDVTIEPLRKDHYGMLRRGILHIEAKVSMALSRSVETFQHQALYVGSERIGSLKYDYAVCEDCAPGGIPIMVFLMCCLNSKKGADGASETYAIVLQPVLDAADGVPGTMRRVGLAWGIGVDFWKSTTILTKLAIC
jgi:hypothetical protein